jgi:hypothetical protein
VDEHSNPPINIPRPIAMAYNGFNGYADDQMDIETSGPKVVVREVRSSRSHLYLSIIAVGNALTPVL